jgi:hypothetical protein
MRLARLHLFHRTACDAAKQRLPRNAFVDELFAAAASYFGAVASAHAPVAAILPFPLAIDWARVALAFTRLE